MSGIRTRQGTGNVALRIRWALAGHKFAVIGAAVNPSRPVDCRSFAKVRVGIAILLRCLFTMTDFNATIALAMGIDLKAVEHSPSGCPFTVADKGKPVMEVLA